MVPNNWGWEMARNMARSEGEYEVSTIRNTQMLFSRYFYYHKWRHDSLKYLLDLWDSKWKWRKSHHVSEAECVMSWQAIMALRRIFRERGYWNRITQSPFNPYAGNEAWRE